MNGLPYNSDTTRLVFSALPSYRFPGYYMERPPPGHSGTHFTTYYLPLYTVRYILTEATSLPIQYLFTTCLRPV